MKGQIEMKVVIGVYDISVIKKYQEETAQFKEAIIKVLTDPELMGNVERVRFQLKD